METKDETIARLRRERDEARAEADAKEIAFDIACDRGCTIEDWPRYAEAYTAWKGCVAVLGKSRAVSAGNKGYCEADAARSLGDQS